jgi:hypothetical protein
MNQKYDNLIDKEVLKKALSIIDSMMVSLFGRINDRKIQIFCFLGVMQG